MSGVSFRTLPSRWEVFASVGGRTCRVGQVVRNGRGLFEARVVLGSGEVLLGREWAAHRGAIVAVTRAWERDRLNTPCA